MNFTRVAFLFSIVATIVAIGVAIIGGVCSENKPSTPWQDPDLPLYLRRDLQTEQRFLSHFKTAKIDRVLPVPHGKQMYLVYYLSATTPGGEIMRVRIPELLSNAARPWPEAGDVSVSMQTSKFIVAHIDP